MSTHDSNSLPTVIWIALSFVPVLSYGQTPPTGNDSPVNPAAAPAARLTLISTAGPATEIPELKRLAGMAGEWKVEMRRKGESQIFHVDSKADWILGGRFLRSQYRGDGIAGMMLTTYDSESKRFRRWQFDQSGKTTAFTGHWDEEGQTMHFTHVSEDGNLRIVVENKRSEDGLREQFRIVVKDKDGQELNEFEGTSQRVPVRTANSK